MSRAPWNNISGGSPHPEWWLSNSGQVAQTAPEYSISSVSPESRFPTPEYRFPIFRNQRFPSPDSRCKTGRNTQVGLEPRYPRGMSVFKTDAVPIEPALHIFRQKKSCLPHLRGKQLLNMFIYKLGSCLSQSCPNNIFSHLPRYNLLSLITLFCCYDYQVVLLLLQHSRDQEASESPHSLEGQGPPQVLPGQRN